MAKKLSIVLFAIIAMAIAGLAVPSGAAQAQSISISADPSCYEPTETPTSTPVPPTHTPTPTTPPVTPTEEVTETPTEEPTPVYTPTPQPSPEPPWAPGWPACDAKESDLLDWQMQEWLDRCFPQEEPVEIVEIEPTPAPCPDCPPAVCGLTEGNFVRVVIGETEFFWGLSQGQILSLPSIEAGENSGLQFWGTECGLCAEGWAVKDGVAFYGHGMTRWDLAVAIAHAEGRENLLNRDLEAALLVSRAWYADGKPDEGGWYSFVLNQ